jgi:hypothetical protein
MLATTLFALMSAGVSIAAPVTINRRTFTNLDAAATAEAQVRDNSATRAFSAVPIKVSSFYKVWQLQLISILDIERTLSFS